jgi:hypothetical protein
MGTGFFALRLSVAKTRWYFSQRKRLLEHDASPFALSQRPLIYEFQKQRPFIG